MKRTIRMRDGRVSIGGRTYELVTGHRHHFNLKNSRIYEYVITITKSKSLGGGYRFRESGFSNSYMYTLYHGDERLGVICKDSFHKVFFKPDSEKTYNITVEKVEIKRKKK